MEGVVREKEGGCPEAPLLLSELTVKGVQNMDRLLS